MHTWGEKQRCHRRVWKASVSGRVSLGGVTLHNDTDSFLSLQLNDQLLNNVRHSEHSPSAAYRLWTTQPLLLKLSHTSQWLPPGHLMTAYTPEQVGVTWVHLWQEMWTYIIPQTTRRSCTHYYTASHVCCLHLLLSSWMNTPLTRFQNLSFWFNKRILLSEQKVSLSRDSFS